MPGAQVRACSGDDVMRRGMIAVLWALAGLVCGALATFFAGVAIGEVAHISQAEGAYAMSLAFFWAPAGGLVCAGLAAWLSLRR